jgi:molecular chaperone IbpA
MTMRAFDLSPLLRSGVGFDRFDRLFDMALRFDEAGGGYPPYNIEKTGEDSYRITMAVAGFTEDDLAVTVDRNTLTVSGRGKEEKGDAAVQYLHRGIARRAFERRFELADSIEVTGAALENGLLHIELRRIVPEALKPRQIKINAAVEATPDKAA